jgi:hypothetical protein
MALANGHVDWGEPAPRIEFASLTRAIAPVLLVAQVEGGVVVGFLAKCPLLGAVRGRDPALKSAIFVLEHPTREQRKWQLQSPICEAAVNDRFL